MDDLQGGGNTEQLANIMKDDMIEITKIHRCPWLDSNVMDIEDVYVPVRIMAETNDPETYNVPDKIALKDHLELFEENAEVGDKGKKRRKRERKTVL